MSRNFIPLLFAGDINVYSVARAFHEQYDIKASVFGKYLRSLRGQQDYEL